MAAMKYVIFISIAVLLGCTRNSASMDTPPVVDPELSFDIDGVHFVYNKYTDTLGGPPYSSAPRVVKRLAPSSSYPQYDFVAWSGRWGGNDIGLSIVAPSDTLETKQYKDFFNSQRDDHVYVSVAELGYQYYLGQDGDSIEVNITGYSGGIVNGTFSGKLTKSVFPPTGGPDTLYSASLTNGKIINLSVTY
jgi:hypothetical protein